MLIESETEIKWIKVSSSTPLILIGKDVVCFGKGCHMMFYNIVTGQEHIYSACNYEKGDGIHSYAGHRHLQVFAFAERKLNPRIFIMTYPNFAILRTIENGAPEGFLAMTFSEQTYLITLSDLPEFELVVFNWRTTDKLLSINSGITLPNQVISCNTSLQPISVIQYTENKTNFIVWDFQKSYKECIPIKHEIEMPHYDKILSSLWAPDNTLFILNKLGCIYQLLPDFTLELIIYGGVTHGSLTPCFTWYKGGILIQLTDGEIKYYKKTSDKWYEEWEVKPVRLKQLLTFSGKDIVVGWSSEADIVLFDPSKYCFNICKSFKTISVTFCWIYPACNYFASMCDSRKQVKIWEALTGNEVGHFKTNGNISTIASNPVYPYLAVGLDCGTLTLINCYATDKPDILTNFKLYKNDIDKIVFNSNGDIIVTANLDLGLLFVIQGIPGSTMEILRYIEYRRPILNVSVCEDEKYIHLCILVLTDSCLNISQRLVIKSVARIGDKVKKKKYISQKYKFTDLYAINKNKFVGRIFKSKEICVVQCWKKNMKIIQEIHTGHQLCHWKLHYRNHLVHTCGFDGLIIIRSNTDFTKILGALLPHHRYNGGALNVIVDPFMRYAISFGAKTNELICAKFLEKTVEDKVIKETTKKLFDMKYLFAKKTIGFEPEDEFTEKGPVSLNYLEKRRREIIKQEQIQHAKEREAIMNEFLILKKEVIMLLERNLNGPELEKIDILEFYQHILLRQHKEETNKKKCEWTVKYYKDLIRAQDEVWLAMKKKFYDSMDITGTEIKGIFSDFAVESYSVAPGAAQYVHSARNVAMYREIENMLREGDLFRPWENLPDQVIIQKLENPPVIKVQSETSRIMEVLELAEQGDSSRNDLKADPAVYPSDTISDFIEPSKLLYDQNELHTFTQIIFQLKLILNDHESLRSLLNEKHSEMKQQKVKDMHAVLEKNKRLRFILSELGINDIFIDDPEWHSTEDIENIITVKSSEIGITPYISPSEQAILDWQAAEAERLRLLLLADDFRERALMKMMDGVLEVRWEDTLKREIPKPKCMLEKDPETFNEEDLRAIRDYEEKVAFLNYERQMYKNMLEAEYAKTAEQVREIIKKFNSRLRDLLLYKIRIESARIQQTIIIQRAQRTSVRRFRMNFEEEQIKEDIKRIEKHIVKVNQDITNLYTASTECRSQGEILLAKEKQLEKNFKRDLQDHSALIQEQGLKLYRKQPKMSSKGFNCVALLVELGTCCANQEKSTILTQECVDYLRSVDNLDQYIGVPNTIDEAMYKNICKHRRLRIEIELKIKANTVEQQDIDSSILAFQKYLTAQKETLAKTIANLQDKRNEKLQKIQDKKLQIVMPKGLVEVPLEGHINDFDDAIMINRKDVETINKAILKAGSRKLEVMNEKMIHRRSILMKEWEHRKMKMQIEDLEEHLYVIDHVKVTKEVQQYLRQRAKGESFDSGILTLDQEIEAQKKSYEKIMNERLTLINELERQIKEYKRKNKTLDQQIADINVDVCEQQESRDIEFEQKYEHESKNRMRAIIKRSKLVKQIQDQHNEILVLQTELELLRLKTYPTLKFKTLF